MYSNLNVSLDLSTCAVIGAEIAKHIGAHVVFDTSPIADQWMKTADAAAYLKIGKSELHRLVSRGVIPHEQERPGCALYFNRDDLDQWRRRRSL